jgi:glycosyltransferase involved in cell wall biosynthesis
MSDRLRICYAAPGHALRGTSGSTRNILSLAAALSAWADVTVAFHSIGEQAAPRGIKVIAIRDGPPRGAAADVPAQDDVAARGVNPLGHAAYLHTLRRFAGRHASEFDLVLEKGWRLSGALLAGFRGHGVPGMLVENDVRHWAEPIRDLHGTARYLLHLAAQVIAGFHSRGADLVIAETEQLGRALIRWRHIRADRLAVVGLGLDHALFRPQPRADARQRLGLPADAHLLLYVGGLDLYHDLGPVIRALGRARPPAVELHVVGDGIRRADYVAEARRMAAPVRFHGVVQHREVPHYIAAADACLAPYRESAFPGREVGLFSLKIPEYMACGRAVISVPSGHVRNLIEHQRSGLLFANQEQAWIDYLDKLPPAAQLDAMGCAAAEAVAAISWESTAARYLALAEKLLQGREVSRTRPLEGSTRGDQACRRSRAWHRNCRLDGRRRRPWR